jgi:hypothetical protein
VHESFIIKTTIGRTNNQDTYNLKQQTRAQPANLYLCDISSNMLEAVAVGVATSSSTAGGGGGGGRGTAPWLLEDAAGRGYESSA